VKSTGIRSKITPRSGWVKRGVGNSKKEEVESVADHTHLVCLIAWFLLPDGLENDPSYDKWAILEMLLVHDIAEAFTRDHVVVEFGNEERRQYLENEAAAMQYIRMKDTYPGIFGAASAFYRWREFEERAVDKGEHINALVAKDMDRLENLLQLHLYRSRLNVEEHIAFKDGLLQMFQTDIVRGLAKDFDNWCQRQGLGPRKRFAQFDFPRTAAQPRDSGV
jgi:5'-deoxynucleotidase YfbR-like HD superfamily hydrolase